MSAVLQALGTTVLDVMHDTTYRYASEVALAHHIAYLRPAETLYQELDSFRLGIVPKPFVERMGTDVFGNSRCYFSLDVPHARLAVRAVSRVRVVPRYIDFEAASTFPWLDVVKCLSYRAGSHYESESEFAYPSPFIPRHRELGLYAATSFTAGRTIAEGAIDLMRRVHRDFRYDADSTDISTPVLDAFNAKRGVCQDFAHVMIGGLRALGLAARYVSGYLLTQPPPGRPRLVGADASHAWASVWCPRADAKSVWLDLDPTNDVVPGTSHVTLGVGRDFGDVSPLRGIIRGGGDHALTVGVTVRPVGEA
ncbi:MAG: transglutaminase family protein [Burkholderiaceae bacterium]